jgi:cyanate permease
MRAVGVVGLLGRLFGMHSLGQLIGITIALAQGVGAVGPYIAGYIFDQSGTYSLTFVGLGVLVTAAAVLASRLRSSVSIEQGESDPPKVGHR